MLSGGGDKWQEHFLTIVRIILAIWLFKWFRFTWSWLPTGQFQQGYLGQFYKITWNVFLPVIPNQVGRILQSVSSTTCLLNPCPPPPPIDQGFLRGDLPLGPCSDNCMKGIVFAVLKVHPLLKRPSLNPTILDNFHPLSNHPL